VDYFVVAEEARSGGVSLDDTFCVLRWAGQVLYKRGNEKK
jgi:hypothetical protein